MQDRRSKTFMKKSHPVGAENTWGATPLGHGFPLLIYLNIDPHQPRSVMPGVTTPGCGEHRFALCMHCRGLWAWVERTTKLRNGEVITVIKYP